MDNLKFVAAHAEWFSIRARRNSVMRTIYLSLGSNLGDREANLRAALTALEPAGVRVRKLSSVYETEPVDYLDQPWFLNCVVEADTNHSPTALLEALHSIEAQLGSNKDFAKGPRKIDLDILLYDSETVDTPELQIPHPRMVARRFVLAPLAEIAPNLSHPAWHGTAGDLLQGLADPSRVKRIDAA